MKKQEGCTNYIPMAFLISIIVFLYGTFLGSYIPPLLMKASDAPSSILSGTFLQPYGHPLAYMIIMNILFFMMALSFSCAHFSDPGKVPYEWVRLSKEVVGRGVVVGRSGSLCFLPQPPTRRRATSTYSEKPRVFPPFALHSTSTLPLPGRPASPRYIR